MTTIKYFDRDIKFFFNKDNHNCAVNKSIRGGRIWEKNLINIYKEYIDKDSVVLDLGANLGTHTVPLSLLCKKVYAFEPQEKIFNILKETVEYNGLDNVKLYNYIVSNKDDVLDFLNTGCGRAGELKNRPRLSGNISKERSLKIDSLNLDKCDFIKIDVEGSEWDALAGAADTINKFRPVMILETWKTKNNMLRLVKFTQKYNYSFRYISSDNYLLKCNTS